MYTLRTQCPHINQSIMILITSATGRQTGPWKGIIKPGNWRIIRPLFVARHWCMLMPFCPPHSVIYDSIIYITHTFSHTHTLYHSNHVFSASITADPLMAELNGVGGRCLREKLYKDKGEKTCLICVCLLNVL